MKKIIEELTSKHRTDHVHRLIKRDYQELFSVINEIDAPNFKTKLFMFYHDVEQIPLCEFCKEKIVELYSFNIGFRDFCSNSCSSKQKYKIKLENYNKLHNTNLTKCPEDRKTVEKRQKTMIDRYGSIMPINDNAKIKDKAEKTSLDRYGVKKAAHAKSARDKAAKTMKNRSMTEKEKSMQKSKNTCLEKLGVENPIQHKDIQEKAKNTRVEKYGVEYCLQNKEISARQVEKAKKTFQEKYDVDSYFKTDEYKEKFKSFSQLKYGVDHPMKNKEIQQNAYNLAQKSMMEKYGISNPRKLPSSTNKIKNTMLKNYGVEHYSQHTEFKERYKKTCFEKFGVEHPMQNSHILEKTVRHAYKRKSFIWQTGETSLVQGNEPIVLKELEESGYKFSDVLTSVKDMPEIWYVHDGNQHRYYPDIFIPSENLIIEVKSEYTLNKELNKNEAKFEAVRNAGFEFRLEVR